MKNRTIKIMGCDISKNGDYSIIFCDYDPKTNITRMRLKPISKGGRIKRIARTILTRINRIITIKVT